MRVCLSLSLSLIPLCLLLPLPASSSLFLPLPSSLCLFLLRPPRAVAQLELKMLTEGEHAYVDHDKTVIIHASLVRHHLNDLDAFLAQYRTLCAQVHVTTTAVTLKVCPQSSSARSHPCSTNL
jgi:hypothetical protein